MSAYSQTPDELSAHLADHIAFLKASAVAFDEGFDAEAKRLAVSLRVLLHDTNSSHSLLGQLGRLDLPFLSTAVPRDSRSIIAHTGLVMIAGRGVATRHEAMLDGVPMVAWRSFAEWWNEVIIVDDERAELTRRALVLAVANRDGGAHVDPKLNETYARLSRANSIGWTRHSGGQSAPIGMVEWSSIRQIAHEVLRTLVPDYRAKNTKPAEAFFGNVMVYDGVPPEFASVPVVGRNEPCPCESGRKYKKCHGGPTA